MARLTHSVTGGSFCKGVQVVCWFAAPIKLFGTKSQMHVMHASWVLGLRHSHRNSRWRHRVPLAFPVLAGRGGRWGRARSAGHQASRASPAPRAALVSVCRAPERACASRPRRGDLLPIRLDPMLTVHGRAALYEARGLRGCRAARRGRCAMVVVVITPATGSERTRHERE